MRATPSLRTPILVAVLIGTLAATSVLAESMDCSGSAKSKEQPTREVIKPGDRTDRQLAQSVKIDVISSHNPEFDGAEQIAYEHADTVGGSGTHRGYMVYVLRSGEKLYTKFEGVHRRVTTEKGWESRYQGVFHFIAGTGKYTAIRGEGQYQGIATPAGAADEFTCSATY